MAASLVRYNANGYPTSGQWFWRNAKFLYELLVAGGWTLLSSPPSFDLATWNESPGTNPCEFTFAMSDALQATAPVYLRVLYRSLPANQSLFNSNPITADLYLGTTNGGCDLLCPAGSTFDTNNRRPDLPVLVLLGQASANGDVVFAGSAGADRFVFCNSNVGTYPSLFGIERTKDLDGTPNADGVMISYYSGNIGYTSFFRVSLFARPESVYCSALSPCPWEGTGNYPDSRHGEGYDLTQQIGCNSYLDSGMFPFEHHQGKAWLGKLFASAGKNPLKYPSENVFIPKRNYNNTPLALWHPLKATLFGVQRTFLYVPVGVQSFWSSYSVIRFD